MFSSKPLTSSVQKHLTNVYQNLSLGALISYLGAMAVSRGYLTVLHV